MREFTGEESAFDILIAVLEDFPSNPVTKEAKATIEFQGDLPFLKYQSQVKNNRGEFTCYYRIDAMLLAVFPECERVYNETKERWPFDRPESEETVKQLVRQLAYYAMTTTLSFLMVRQLTMFSENFNDTMFLTTSTLLHAFAVAYANDARGTKAANDAVRTLLDKRLNASTKKHRADLVKLVNSLPTLHIQTGQGRPKGSTKPAEKKAQEAAEFEKEVEETIKTLLSTTGEMPTKTAVAKELGIGGLSAKTGVDSSLAAFRNKLDRLNVDYNAIVERVKLNR